MFVCVCVRVCVCVFRSWTRTRIARRQARCRHSVLVTSKPNKSLGLDAIGRVPSHCCQAVSLIILAICAGLTLLLLIVDLGLLVQCIV